MPAVTAHNLTRVYVSQLGFLRRREKQVTAVDGIDLQVARGELFGLLGSNGAGKTTVKLLTTLLTPTAGAARVLGFDLVRDAEKIRPRSGFIFGGERGLYWRLSGWDNLAYFTTLYHVFC